MKTFALKIAVNTRLLLKGKLEGIGRFSWETLQRLCKNHPEVQFYFLFDRPFDSSFVQLENVTPLSLFPPARHEVLYYLWFNFAIPSALKKIKPDLFLSPDGFLSQRLQIPQLPVIHDLNFLHRPQDLPKRTARYYNHFFPQFAQIAKRIATVSEFTKEDIAQNYQIDPGKIDVVYNGVGNEFSPISEEEKQRVRTKYTQGAPYFAYIGSLHPRKNIRNMLLAFEQLKSSQDIPHKFVIIGASMWNDDLAPLVEKMSCKDDILFTGRVSNMDLSHLLSSAFALMYVSFFEGFGIPIIEGFKSGTPVITADVTSMPEVAGDSALTVPPDNSEAISNAMNQLVTYPELRANLINKGLERAQLFTWENSADQLWASIEKTLGT